MLYLPTIGHIKFGGVQRDLPFMFEKIKLTGLSKNGAENFSPFSGSDEEGYDSLKIRLPLLTDSFQSGKISFVDILDNKYYVKIIGEEIYAIPFGNRDLPVIKQPLTEQLVEKLKMQDRAILFATIPMSSIDKDASDCEFLGGGMGVFTFKTSSVYSTSEMNNVMELLSSLPAYILGLLDLTIEVTSKMLSLKDKTDVSYVRLLPPSIKDISDAAIRLQNNPIAASFIQSMFKNIKESMDAAIKSAITLDDAAKIFGKKVVIKVSDDETQGEVTAPSKMEELSDEDNAIAVTFVKQYKLPLPLVKSVIKNFGAKETESIIKANPSVSKLVALIGNKDKKPTNTPAS